VTGEPGTEDALVSTSITTVAHLASMDDGREGVQLSLLRRAPGPALQPGWALLDPLEDRLRPVHALLRLDLSLVPPGRAALDEWSDHIPSMPPDTAAGCACLATASDHRTSRWAGLVAAVNQSSRC
jgi:hypothetical protein